VAGNISLSNNIFNYDFARIHYMYSGTNLEEDLLIFTEHYTTQTRFSLKEALFLSGFNIWSAVYYISTDGRSLILDGTPSKVEIVSQQIINMEHKSDFCHIKRVTGINF
jgi:hypothetical protein